MAMTALTSWHDYMKSQDPGMLWDLLDPEAVFESPVVHTPQRGREITFKYLMGAAKVLGGSGFRTPANGAAITASCWNLRKRSKGS